MQRFWPTHWEHPEVLWGLMALPLLLFLLWIAWRQKRRVVHQWSQVSTVLQRSLLPTRWAESWRALLLLSAYACALFGFASPTVHTLVWEPTWERVSLGLLVDVSPSMGAAASPGSGQEISRLAMLQDVVQDLIEHLPDGVRVGVIAFAGVAVPIVPEASADHQAVLAKVRRLDTHFIRNPGTALSSAIQQGLALFVDPAQGEQPTTASLILLSDGDTTITPSLRRTVTQTSIPIYTLGIGSPRPTRIPDANAPGGFMVNAQGHPLTTRVNAAVLRFIAERTGGTYYPFTERVALAQTLRRIVAQHSRQVLRQVPHSRSVRRLFFGTAVGCLFLYLFSTRKRWKRSRPSPPSTRAPHHQRLSHNAP
jgi:Ca-activated chloride channel family protein